MSVYSKLLEVQKELKAPKNQYNSFGKYKYRSCEDILEAAKPICVEKGLLLSLVDKIVMIGDRYYLEATARVIDVDDGTSYEVTADAREEETKKGMDGSQVTGASSSYARKYALNGLFCIDDTKDSDATNAGDEKTSTPTQKTTAPKPKTDKQKLEDACAGAVAKGKKDELIDVLGGKKIKDLTADEVKAMIPKVESL
jgi:hypothetical protein